MIDMNARRKLSQNNRGQEWMGGVFKATAEAMDLKKENQEIMGTVKDSNKEVISNLGVIARNLVAIYKAIPKTISLPKIFPITGKVEVTKTPAVEISNLGELKKELRIVQNQLAGAKPQPYPTSFVVDNFFEIKEYFDNLGMRLDGLASAISSMPAPQIKIPKMEMPKITVPKSDKSFADFTSKFDEFMERMEEAVAKSGTKEIKFPREINVGNFPPQMVPQPVTNININPLQGIIKTTVQIIGTTVVQVPSYGQLFNRRSLQFYNNSSNTIYYGGSDVTTGNGIPVAAGDFSDILDAGYNMIVYAVAGTTGNEIRVLEVASRSEGGVAIQE